MEEFMEEIGGIKFVNDFNFRNKLESVCRAVVVFVKHRDDDKDGVICNFFNQLSEQEKDAYRALILFFVEVEREGVKLNPEIVDYYNVDSTPEVLVIEEGEVKRRILVEAADEVLSIVAEINKGGDIG